MPCPGLLLGWAGTPKHGRLAAETVAGAIALRVLPYLILIFTSTLGGGCLYYSCFINKEPKAQGG